LNLRPPRPERGSQFAAVPLSTCGGILSTIAVRLVRPVRSVGPGFVPFLFPDFRSAPEATDAGRMTDVSGNHPRGKCAAEEPRSWRPTGAIAAGRTAEEPRQGDPHAERSRHYARGRCLVRHGGGPRSLGAVHHLDRAEPGRRHVATPGGLHRIPAAGDDPFHRRSRRCCRGRNRGRRPAHAAARHRTPGTTPASGARNQALISVDKASSIR